MVDRAGCPVTQSGNGRQQQESEDSRHLAEAPYTAWLLFEQSPHLRTYCHEGGATRLAARRDYSFLSSFVATTRARAQTHCVSKAPVERLVVAEAELSMPADTVTSWFAADITNVINGCGFKHTVRIK